MMLRRSLAKALFALAAANAALAGCNKKADQASAEKADRLALPVGETDSEEAKPGDGQGVATGSGSGSPVATVTKEEVGTMALDEGKMRRGDKNAAKSAGIVGSGGRSGQAFRQPPPPPDAIASNDGFTDHGVNAWVDTATDKLSTFAVDVDTASYTIVRRSLTGGALPPTAAVRVEEFVNYFEYGYPAPDGGRPFSVHADAAPSPFNKGRQIVRVGVATKAKSIAERKAANLVFLVDVSGSMAPADRLDLAKRSLRILVDNLHDGDSVSLVTYAGSTRVVLEPTGIENRDAILSAIEDLSSGGSTAMASGIDLAYEQAMKMMKGDSVTRVIILSDGDANVGKTSHEEILATIAGKVSEGVTLSTIGFGMGNYKDTMMEQLANKGNGNNYYIDGLSQAKRVFQQQLGSTLEVVAKDVKLQVEFDPRVVKRYRLIGYENRNIADADFRKDEVDAGEIGAGHQVTALYEIELASTTTADVTPDDLLTVHIRHKAPKGTKADEAAFGWQAADMSASFAAAPADLRFAFAVAAFADVLRGAEDAEHWALADIRAIAAGAAEGNADRLELVDLIDKAIALKGGAKTAAK